MELIIEYVKILLDYLLHFEVHLDYLITNYNQLTYLLLFLIIFVETGLIIMPFLPGDSLLFAVGAICARGSLNLTLIIFLLIIAAFLGDTLNYFIGKFVGKKVFDSEDSIWLNKKHLVKAQNFYEKYGAKTIIIARFIPIVRTFAPFVAGVGVMNYSRYMLFNLLGGALWVILFTMLGFVFGNLPAVQANFKIVILAIIVISILPGVFEFYREKRKQSL
jgi:membrane-associated protein